MNYERVIPISTTLDPLIDKILASKGRLYRMGSQKFSDYLSLLSEQGEALVEIAETQTGYYTHEGERFLAIKYVFVSSPSEIKFIEFIPVPYDLSDAITNVEALQGFIEENSKTRLAMAKRVI